MLIPNRRNNVLLKLAAKQPARNEPDDPGLWSRAISEAKKRFTVYPSAYANGWAAKWYKERGGSWSKEKQAADRSTKEMRKALKSGDVERMYRLAEGTAGNRPRLIKPIGRGADADAFLIHGGGHAEPTVAKIVADQYRTPGVKNLLQESVDLKRVLGDRFADIRPLRGGAPYKTMTDRIGGLVQEWVPHEANLAPAIAARRQHFLDFEFGPGVPKDIVEDAKNLRKLERALWKAEAEVSTSELHAAQTAFHEARDALEAKFGKFQERELKNNPAYVWAQEVQNSPSATQNKVWDIAGHAGNVRKTRAGSYKLIDARLGDRKGGFVTNQLPSLEAPRTGKIRTKNVGTARLIGRQAWLPDLLGEMGEANPPRLSKFQAAKLKKELARTLSPTPEAKPAMPAPAERIEIPTPAARPALPAPHPTAHPTVLVEAPVRQAERMAGRKVGGKALGLAALGSLGLLGAGMAIHKIRNKPINAKGRFNKAASVARKDVGHGGLDEWFSGHGKDKGRAQWGDWVAISPIRKQLKSGRVVEPGDIVGQCGISDSPDWRQYTKGGQDPLKCMPRKKALAMSQEQRAALARGKARAERSSDNTGAPVMTRTFGKSAML